MLIAIIDELDKVQQRLGLRGKKASNEAKETHQAQQEDKDVDCWRCGKGHPANQCWSKQLKCHGCKQTGHIMSQCTKIAEFKSKRSERKGKGAASRKGKGKDRKGKGDNRVSEADKEVKCEDCEKRHQIGQRCGLRNSMRSTLEKEIADQMGIPEEKFKKKLAKSANIVAKKKRTDAEEMEAQLKELKKQVKEMKESNLSNKKSESASDDSNDYGWSKYYGNRSDLCERMVTQLRCRFRGYEQ